MEDVLSAIENSNRGIQWEINNKYINYLAYADDICMLSHRLCDLKQQAADLQERMQYTGLKINTSKTKTLNVGANTATPLTLGDHTYNCVPNFCYLGCEIDAGGGSDLDVNARINKARSSFGILAPIWQSNKISLHT